MIVSIDAEFEVGTFENNWLLRYHSSFTNNVNTIIIYFDVFTVGSACGYNICLLTYDAGLIVLYRKFP
jgi:hypothetical protein